MKYLEPVKALTRANNTLGEGPIWDGANNRVIWVDILEKSIHTLNISSTRHETRPAPGLIGCVGLTNQGRWIAAIEHTVGILDPKTNNFEPLIEVESDLPRNRFNDGKCAPDGGFIVGSMDMDERTASGALYRFSSNGELKTLVPNRTISNGITWSPDLRTIYTIDTPTMRVVAHDYDPSNGNMTSPRVVFEIPAGMGFPDGMTSDTAGNLWIAMWGGARITVWDPMNGALVGELPVPALNPTCCVFGGQDGGTLFITSARVGMSEEQLEQYPLSGSLFFTRIEGVTGSAGFEFKE